MTKYFTSNAWGNGFITHEDQSVSGLSFVCLDEIHKVSGGEKEIYEWAKRVEAKEITEKEYIVALATKEKDGAINRISQIETEKVNLLSLKQYAEAVLSANK
jgi:hypothetical protein